MRRLNFESLVVSWSKLKYLALDFPNPIQIDPIAYNIVDELQKARLIVVDDKILDDAVKEGFALSGGLVMPPLHLPLPFEFLWLEPEDEETYFLMAEHKKFGGFAYLGMLVWNQAANESDLELREIGAQLNVFGLCLRLDRDRLPIPTEPPFVYPTFINRHNPHGPLSRHLLFFLHHLMNNVYRTSEKGVESVNIRSRISVNGNRSLHKIKHIIRVTSKAGRKALVDQGAKIDWSHSWEVAGHWRKNDGIGKGPNGEYNVNGFTWVKPHTKGKGQLVKKIRIISTEEKNIV